MTRCGKYRKTITNLVSWLSWYSTATSCDNDENPWRVLNPKAFLAVRTSSQTFICMKSNYNLSLKVLFLIPRFILYVFLVVESIFVVSLPPAHYNFCKNDKDTQKIAIFRYLRPCSAILTLRNTEIFIPAKLLLWYNIFGQS